MAGLGLTRADYIRDEECDVFRQNWEAVKLFESLSSQWRVGPGGPTGLDYPSLKTVFEILNISKRRWPQLFDDVRVMEDEALLTIHDK